MSEQQEQDISQIIDTELEAIQSGAMSLDEVLKQHPDQAELIRSELELAMWLTSKQSEVAPRAGFVHASRKRVVERIQQEASQRGTKHMLFGFLWPPRFVYRTAAAIVVIFILFIASSGVVSAAQGAIPGDGLYGVKRFTEQVSYQVTMDPAQRVDMSVRYAGRRLNEAQALIARGDMPRADAALQEYQQQVKLAIVELDRIPVSQTTQKSEKATLLQSNLAQHEDRLEGLKASAPAAASGPLEEALNVTTSGISNATTVFNTVNHITPTPTSTSTDVPTLEPTDTPVPTFTPVPSQTPTLTPGDGTPTLEGTPSPDSTLSLGAKDAQPSPTPTLRYSKTPKPDGKDPGKPVEPPGKKPPPKKDDPPKGNSGK